MFDTFLIFAQNIDCGYTLEPRRRGGSNEYPQSMFWNKNKKNRYTSAYPIKCGSRGYIFRDVEIGPAIPEKNSFRKFAL